MLLRYTKSCHNAALTVLTKTFIATVEAAELLLSVVLLKAFRFPSRLHFSNFLSLFHLTFDNKTRGGASKVFIIFSVINVRSFIKPTPKFFFVSSSSSTTSRLQSSCVDNAPPPLHLHNARGPVGQGAPNVRNTEYVWGFFFPK